MINRIKQWWQARTAHVTSEESEMVAHGNWILRALVTGLVLVSAGWMLFYGGRWVYRQFQDDEPSAPAVVKPTDKPEALATQPDDKPAAAADEPVSDYPTSTPEPTTIPRSGPADE